MAINEEIIGDRLKDADPMVPIRGNRAIADRARSPSGRRGFGRAGARPQCRHLPDNSHDARPLLGVSAHRRANHARAPSKVLPEPAYSP